MPFLGLSLGAPALQQQPQHPLHAQKLSLGGPGLKFNLPQLKNANTGGNANSAAARAPSAAALPDTGRSLRPGFLTGGGGDSAEVLRLNALVEDLSAKQRQLSEKLALAEQSVARGNAALTSERAMSNARITALSAEVKSAQQRELAVRTELANVPRMEALDKEKFKLQAEGAVELQARHEELTEKAAVLEGVVHDMKVEREALVEQHAALATQLDEAKAALEAAEARLRRQRRPSRGRGADAGCRGADAGDRGADRGGGRGTDAGDRGRDRGGGRSRGWPKRTARPRVGVRARATARGLLRGGPAEQVARPQAARGARGARASGRRAMREAEEARAALEELELQAAEDMPAEFQDQFDAYHACKTRAEQLQARVQEAGIDAAAADVAEMAKARMEARRMHRAVVTGAAPTTS